MDDNTLTVGTERFIEHQAFLRSYYSAPRPPTPLPFSSLSLFLSLPVCRLLQGKGEEDRGRRPIIPREKAWPSRNHSILFALQPVER